MLNKRKQKKQRNAIKAQTENMKLENFTITCLVYEYINVSSEAIVSFSSPLNINPPLLHVPR